MRYQPDPVHGAILIVLLVLCIAVCGCTGPGSAPSPAATQTQVSGSPTINIQNFAFVPASITVAQGTTVTWVNLDPSDHTVASDPSAAGGPGSPFESPTLSRGGQYSLTFNTAGTYPYYCSIHPSMKGTIIVQ